MIPRRAAILMAWACLGLVTPARADTSWLPADARAIPRATSASRDTPVTELAYGPRAYGTLGMEHGIVATPTWHLGLYAAFAYENDRAGPVFPQWLLGRELEGISSAYAMPLTAERWFGKGSMLELTLVLGRERVHEDVGANIDAYRTTDIPWGGGGWFVAPDVALRLPAAKHLSLVTRFGDRVFMNAFPLMFGQREASNVVASYAEEGLTQAPWVEMTIAWRASRVITPLFALHSEVMLAHDDSARDAFLIRSLLGLALPGEAGTLMPFLSGEAGNGKGLYINRRELRLSAGVRLWFGGGVP